MLPDKSVSFWMDTVKFKDYPAVEKDLNVDVVIIGAGITGITCCYLLKKQGLRVALLDVDKIASGTTGHTTAKLTIQHDLIYDKLINNFGREKAQIYADSNKKGMDLVVSLVRDKNINCDLEMQNSYIYTRSDDYISSIEKEVQAARDLNIKAEFETNLPLPFDVKGAVCFTEQYQFHPLKYLKVLCDEMDTDGETIYENTKVTDVVENQEESRKLTVLLDGGRKISCDYAVMACHYPFTKLEGLYLVKMYTEKSYVVAAKTLTDFTNGVYKNAGDPSRSLRSILLNNGERAVIFGGESHKTGTEHDTMKHFENLLNFAKDTYGVKEVLYRWSTHDCVPLDDVPYIGHFTGHSENVFVASGFNKWGMTTSQLAAIMIRDLIVEKTSPWEALYDPTRFNFKASVKNLVKNTGGVINNLILRKITPAFDVLQELAPDEGRVVTVDGEKMCAYRDKEGKVHLVESACTHLRCELQWNSGEKTWDCPCHGSRFSIDGEVIEGPTLERLRAITVPYGEEEQE